MRLLIAKKKLGMIQSGTKKEVTQQELDSFVAEDEAMRQHRDLMEENRKWRKTEEG